MILTKPSILKYSLVFLLLFSVSLLGSCKKFFADAKIELTFNQVQPDGSVKVFAEIVSGGKKIENVGFCFGKTSLPEADIYSSSMVNTIPSSIENENFSAIIPEIYFESYTGYYIRPYAQTKSGVIYGEQIYLESVQAPEITPDCTPSDNYVHMGLSNPGPHIFSQVGVSYGPLSEYRVRAWAYSNLDELEFEFRRKPKTGVYKSSEYASDDNSMVKVMLTTGSISRFLESGYPIYVNEVEKDKFEITLCAIPWKFSGSTTLHVTSKIIVE